MKQTAVIITSCILPVLAGSIPARADRVIGWDEAYRMADDKIKELTLEEKLRFTRGYSEFYFYGVPDKGIPYLYHSDATQGVHIRHNLKDTTLVRQMERSTAVPCPVMLAATFDEGLAGDYGRAVGEECRAGGIEVLLGPGVNIARNSQCGRNFEYLGEDPLLTGAMAAAYIRGLQSTGTAGCVKHFLCNETEFYRRRSNSVVDERALHEIYLPPFRDAVDAGVAFVMTSYNRLNGEWTGQNKWLIDTLLRDGMGFRGSVMSDWSSVYDTFKVVHSGLNTVMPGNSRFSSELAGLVADGKISEADIDRMIRPAIATGIAYGLYGRTKYSPELLDRFQYHCALATEVAEKGTVLLKNSGVLPLGGCRDILVTGPFTDSDPRAGDNPASSADVKGYDYVTLRAALSDEFGDRVKFVNNPTESELQQADIVITTTGTVDMESFERPFALPRDEETRLKNIVRHNPNTVILVFSGSGIRMTGWADKAASILYCWYPGQTGMKAIAGILSGRVNPSGKLPVTIERDFRDSPARETMPAGAEFYNTAYRAYNEKLITLYDVNYDESVLVGYRWYDTKSIEPMFPFGHGLSYTSFEIGKAKAKVGDDGIEIEVTVSNTGDRDGSETIQVYIGENNPTVIRPVRELKAFRRIDLKAGKRENVRFSVPVDKIGYRDTVSHQWKVNDGEYTVSIGRSSRDIDCMLPVMIRQ